MLKKVVAANFHTVAVTEEGRVYAWGNDGSAIDQFYQNALPMKCAGLLIGQGDAKERKDEHKKDIFWEPIEVEIGEGENKKAKDISAGFAHTAVVTKDGSLYTWGFGWFAVLGLTDKNGRSKPTKVTFYKNNQKKITNISSKTKIQILR